MTWTVADLMPAPSPGCLFQQLDLVAVLLGPARVHAQQHAGPVLALGAAGAGMDFEIGVVGVGLARQQRFELAPRGFGLEPLERAFGFGDDALILLGLAEFDHADVIVELALDPADGVELVLERVALLHHALGACGVVPEVGVFGLRVQFGEARLGCIEVKDASSAVRSDRLMSSTSFSVSARMMECSLAERI